MISEIYTICNVSGTEVSARHYHLYSDRKWGTIDGMELMINSSSLGIESKKYAPQVISTRDSHRLMYGKEP